MTSLHHYCNDVMILLLMAGVKLNPGSTASTQMLKFGLLNARSIANKAALLHDIITDHRLDMFAITETWVYEDSPNVHKQEAAPDGYSITHAHSAQKPGSGRAHGGGGAFIQRDDIRVKVIPINSAV